MNDDPAAGAPQGTGQPDPLDDTQRVEVPRYAPTPDPRPDAQWAWASTGDPADRARGRIRDPAGRRRTGGSAAPTPARRQRAERAMGSLAAPAAAPAWTPPAPVATAPDKPGRRRGAGLGTIVTVSVLSAVLASGGTVLVLERGRRLRPPGPASTIATGTQTRLPAAGDDRRVVGGHRRGREGRARRRQDRHRGRDRRPVHRAGRRLRPDLRLERLDPHQPARDRRRQQAHRRAQGRPPVPGHGLRHRHPDRPRDRQDRPDRPADRADRRTPTASRSGSWSSRSGARSGPTRSRSPAASCRARAGPSPSTAASASRT